MKNKPRVLIMGSGAAGLSAAIEAAEAGAHVTIITKALYRKQTYAWQSNGGCSWKTHSFNVAAAPGDTVESHVKDTLKGGDFAGNPELVKILCSQALELIPWLTKMGVVFEFEGSTIATRPFGGCEVPRAVFREDRLGFYIIKAFMEKLESLKDSIDMMEGYRGLHILKDSHHHVCGIRALNIDTLEEVDFYGDALIIADGGGASMYAPTAVSADKTSDGIVMAYEAGAKIIDMEFVQFHPTGISSKTLVFDGSLVEEALRFDGALLYNKYGKRFMPEYNGDAETSTRDHVSRAMFSEIIQHRGFSDHSVILDFSKCRDLIQKRYPALFERMVQSGFDPRVTNTIHVKPTAHYLMGGIMIDETSASSLPGVFAAGESAGGVHGANRLGGNGLTEALVFGRIAGKNAASFALGKENKSTKNEGHNGTTISGHLSTVMDGAHTADGLLNRLRSEMYWNVGPVRHQKGLSRMLATIEELQGLSCALAFTSGAQASDQVQNYLTLKNLLTVSEIICTAALNRKESRGSHFREDYPQMEKEYKGQGVKLLDQKTPTWFSYNFKSSHSF